MCMIQTMTSGQSPLGLAPALPQYIEIGLAKGKAFVEQTMLKIPSEKNRTAPT